MTNEKFNFTLPPNFLETLISVLQIIMAIFNLFTRLGV